MPDLRDKFYAFAIDVSGTPFSNVCFGMIAYNRNNFYKLKTEFQNEFPLFLSKKQKSSNLKPTEIQAIIGFLDTLNVQMASTEITGSMWETYRKRFVNKGKFKEKMYALAELKLLKSFIFPKYNYGVTICNENYLNIESVLENLRRMSKSNGFDFDISIGTAKFNSELKFADFVAGALRKLKRPILERFINYHIIDFKPSYRDSNQTFR